jgi:hypothetical protein
MLRNQPSRLELKGEDLREYEEAKSDWNQSKSTFKRRNEDMYPVESAKDTNNRANRHSRIGFGTGK